MNNIKSIKSRWVTDDNVYFKACFESEVRQLEQERDELLNALIEVNIHIEWRHSISGGFGTYGSIYTKNKKIIESRTGQTYEQLKKGE